MDSFAETTCPIPILVTSGEPAGIGPDLCLDLAALGLPVVVLADKVLLLERAAKLSRELILEDYHPGLPRVYKPGCLQVLSVPCSVAVKAGELNPANSAYVMAMLERAVQGCLQGEFSALVTAPVHKGVINQAGLDANSKDHLFTGHTEWLAARCGVQQVVMMLANPVMKVALLTTHLPLQQVPQAITQELIRQVVPILANGLQRDFALDHPRIAMAGLNPHAGEGGYLGREEIEVIAPAIAKLKQQGLDIHGPFSADTLFTPENLNQFDVFLALYHDQGLPVLKYSGFGQAVNVTLGLPIVRTSVDHGTALELAGTGKAKSESLVAAVEMALKIVNNRMN